MRFGADGIVYALEERHDKRRVGKGAERGLLPFG